MLLFAVLNLIMNPIILVWWPFIFTTEIKASSRYYLLNKFLLSLVWHLKGYPEFTVSVENSHFNCTKCGTNEMRKHITRRKEPLSSKEDNRSTRNHQVRKTPTDSLRHASQGFYLAILHISFPPEILRYSPLPGITLIS